MMRAFFAVWTLTLCTPAAAYETTGFVWRLPTPYQVNADSAAELGAETALQVIAASYATWAAPACSGVVSEFRGRTPANQAHYSGDGVNTLIWYYRPNQRPPELGGRETIGVTLSISQGRRAVDGDILFNGYDHRWTTNPTQYGEVDAESIITHEVGHQFGLNHSPFQRATMYAAYLGGSGARTLDRDDVDGICALYPSGAAAQCGTDDDCPAESSCIGGECVVQPIEEGASLGDDCNQQQSCDIGLACALTSADSGFCTRECDDDCPRGLNCQAVSVRDGNIQICVPDQDMPVGTGVFGDDCEGPNDCGSGFCVGYQGGGFCSQACVSESGCPAGAECAPLQGGGGACLPTVAVEDSEPECFEDRHCSPGFLCSADGICLQRDAGALGSLCGDGMECGNGLFCVNPGDGDPYCTRECGDSCPSAWRCETVLLDNRETNICLPGGGLVTAPTPANTPSAPAQMAPESDAGTSQGDAVPQDSQGPVAMPQSPVPMDQGNGFGMGSVADAGITEPEGLDTSLPSAPPMAPSAKTGGCAVVRIQAEGWNTGLMLIAVGWGGAVFLRRRRRTRIG